jgi:poly(3-hydroxybutyrate) depolymerase
MMFHGSNQSGTAMYEKTNWVARAEQENFIVVFPTSWKYFLTSSNRIEGKWNELVMEVTEPTVEFKDDVHFTKVILDQLNATFNVDEKRIFATGFSNGAFFVVTRLLVQMNDVFAAFATAGMGPSASKGHEQIEIPDTVNASLYKMFGTQEALPAELMGLTLPFPLGAEEIVSDPNFSPMLVQTTTMLGLDMAYTVQSYPNFTKLTFNQSLVGADNEFVFQMIRGMSHVYPDGNNNLARLDATVLFWEFFMRHVKP